MQYIFQLPDRFVPGSPDIIVEQHCPSDGDIRLNLGQEIIQLEFNFLLKILSDFMWGKHSHKFSKESDQGLVSLSLILCIFSNLY